MVCSCKGTSEIREDALGKMLAMKTWGPELGLTDPHKELDTAHLYKLCRGRADTGTHGCATDTGMHANRTTCEILAENMLFMCIKSTGSAMHQAFPWGAGAVFRARKTQSIFRLSSLDCVLRSSSERKLELLPSWDQNFTAHNTWKREAQQRLSDPHTALFPQ